MLARERLTAFRESLGKNKSEFARLLGCHPSYVSMVERGERNPTKGKFTRRLAVLSAKWRVNGKLVGPIAESEWGEDTFEVTPLASGVSR